VVFSRTRSNFSQKKRTRWPTTPQEFVPLGNSVIIAVTKRRRHQPFLAGESILVCLRHYRPIHTRIDRGKVAEDALIELESPTAEYCSMRCAVGRILHAKPSMRHGRKHGRSKTNARDLQLKGFRITEKTCYSLLIAGQSQKQNRPGYNSDSSTHFSTPHQRRPWGINTRNNFRSRTATRRNFHQMLEGFSVVC
jgi:hypothetical protein